MSSVDWRFPSMGGEARVQLRSDAVEQAQLELAARDVRDQIDAIEAALSRFRPDSELSAYNRDPSIALSPIMRAFLRATRFAAVTSGGLVDATLVDEIERLEGGGPACLEDALAAAPARKPGRPRRGEGRRLDSGGIAKGMAADIAAAEVPDGVSYAISCGGDLAVGGRRWEVAVPSARTGAEVHRVGLREGGVATSAIHQRLWRKPDDTYAHHLLDPSTGEPAWTGLVAATAVGKSALEAEVLAKTALLSGPERAKRILIRRGGVLQHDDGMVQIVPALMSIRTRIAA
jgi:thiamine biosynthesis lipoprotein